MTQQFSDELQNSLYNFSIIALSRSEKSENIHKFPMKFMQNLNHKFLQNHVLKEPRDQQHWGVLCQSILRIILNEVFLSFHDLQSN